MEGLAVNKSGSSIKKLPTSENFDIFFLNIFQISAKFTLTPVLVCNVAREIFEKQICQQRRTDDYMLREYNGRWPEVHQTVFIDESAQVIGDVSIGKDSSIWHNAVIRGDVNQIRIGERTNIQDGVVLHGTLNLYPVILEDNVTVGHNATVHGCTVHANCLIGMGAIILDNAEIGENCIIGAGTVVTEGMCIPPNSLVLGIPGRVKRQLLAREIQSLPERATRYVKYKNTYLTAISNRKEVSSL